VKKKINKKKVKILYSWANKQNAEKIILKIVALKIEKPQKLVEHFVPGKVSVI